MGCEVVAPGVCMCARVRTLRNSRCFSRCLVILLEALAPALVGVRSAMVKNGKRQSLPKDDVLPCAFADLPCGAPPMNARPEIRPSDLFRLDQVQGNDVFWQSVLRFFSVRAVQALLAHSEAPV